MRTFRKLKSGVAKVGEQIKNAMSDICKLAKNIDDMIEKRDS